MTKSESSFFPKIKALTGVSYQTWKSDAEYALREKKLWRIVSGLEPRPASPEATPATETESTTTVPEPSAELLAWLEKADEAIGVLGRLIGEKLRHHIEPYKADPATAWKVLKETFGRNTAANIGRLRREFTSLKYDSSKSMSDHLERLQQLAQEIGQAERPLTNSELAIAMLQSMPSDYTVTVQTIEAADKGTDPIYCYTKLVDEEQRRNAEKPQSGSNNKGDNALKASHRISKSSNTRKCYNCNRPGHIARNCQSKKESTNDNNNNSSDNSGGNNSNSNSNNRKGSRKYPPCSTCKKTNHPEDRCFYKKIYEKAKAALAAEAKTTNAQTWGTSPDLSL